jgi:hypothetical protein
MSQAVIQMALLLVRTRQAVFRFGPRQGMSWKVQKQNMVFSVYKIGRFDIGVLHN